MAAEDLAPGGEMKTEVTVADFESRHRADRQQQQTEHDAPAWFFCQEPPRSCSHEPVT
jgi:hypothetical protein